MAADIRVHQSEPLPSPKVIHVSITALESLRGVLVIDSIAFVCAADYTMHCGLSAQPGPITWISLHGVGLWKQGRLFVLPTCPSCSVAWDEAMESYNARKQAST